MRDMQPTAVFEPTSSDSALPRLRRHSDVPRASIHDYMSLSDLDEPMAEPAARHSDLHALLGSHPPLKPHHAASMPCFTAAHVPADLIALAHTSMDELLARASGADGTIWHDVHTSSHDSIVLSKGHVPGFSHPCLKAVGRVDCAAPRLAAKLQDSRSLRAIDATVRMVSVVDEVDVPTYTTVQYIQHEPHFPARGRDYCVVTAVRHVAGDDDAPTIAIASRSVDHHAVPPNPAYVRAEIHVSGYILRPLTSSTCSVTLLRHMNVHGLAPAFVANKADQLVTMIGNMRGLYNDKNGSSASRGPSPTASGSTDDDATDDACVCCGKVVATSHVCMVCHHVVCSECSSHRVKSREWKVHHMCDRCHAATKDDDGDDAKEEDSPVEDKEDNRVATDGMILAYGAIVTSVIWAELPIGSTIVLVVGLSLTMALHLYKSSESIQTNAKACSVAL
ncbi:Aste57867_21277 [Aphanomyces stellatus]|uniref:Aste57867_21277 protein n=1 Tax=Aphanomyces stellatus TaxID=120398 RepID=A0A485LHP7_9STRA|nr:hypothetical protein As57867_021208 [Aphanomyces stellatus]VFT97949.1 Aste57867_21277 [Aphanomyces stellatus]